MSERRRPLARNQESNPMAKGKNEILLSIALEGDAEVKSKLQAVGEASKKSRQGTERSIADASRAAERFGEPIATAREAFAPFLEQSGLGSLGGLLGGGLVSRLFGQAGPGAALAALS